MDMEVSDGEYEILKTIPCPSLPYNTPGTTYVLVKIPDDQTEGIVILLLTDEETVGHVHNSLKSLFK